MLTFVKANISSLAASLCDYLITIAAVRFFEMDVVLAGVTGTTGGGVINFLIGRHWAFSAKEGVAHRQALRYLVVWSGNLLLNALGMYLLARVAGIYYVLAKIITSLLVAICYNYPLQKRYVFKNN